MVHGRHGSPESRDKRTFTFGEVGREYFSPDFLGSDGEGERKRNPFFWRSRRGFFCVPPPLGPMKIRLPPSRVAPPENHRTRTPALSQKTASLLRSRLRCLTPFASLPLPSSLPDPPSASLSPILPVSRSSLCLEWRLLYPGGWGVSLGRQENGVDKG